MMHLLRPFRHRLSMPRCTHNHTSPLNSMLHLHMHILPSARPLFFKTPAPHPYQRDSNQRHLRRRHTPSPILLYTKDIYAGMELESRNREIERDLESSLPLSLPSGPLRSFTLAFPPTLYQLLAPLPTKDPSLLSGDYSMYNQANQPGHEDANRIAVSERLPRTTCRGLSPRKYVHTHTINLAVHLQELTDLGSYHLTQNVTASSSSIQIFG